jgi:hypothetical protein
MHILKNPETTRNPATTRINTGDFRLRVGCGFRVGFGSKRIGALLLIAEKPRKMQVKPFHL